MGVIKTVAKFVTSPVGKGILKGLAAVGFSIGTCVCAKLAGADLGTVIAEEIAAKIVDEA